MIRTVDATSRASSTPALPRRLTALLAGAVVATAALSGCSGQSELDESLCRWIEPKQAELFPAGFFDAPLVGVALAPYTESLPAWRGLSYDWSDALPDDHALRDDVDVMTQALRPPSGSQEPVLFDTLPQYVSGEVDASAVVDPGLWTAVDGVHDWWRENCGTGDAEEQSPGNGTAESAAEPEPQGVKEILVANGFDPMRLVVTDIVATINLDAAGNCQASILPEGTADLLDGDGSASLPSGGADRVEVFAVDLVAFRARWSELDAQFGQDVAAHSRQASLESRLGPRLSTTLGAISPQALEAAFDTSGC